MPDAQSLVLVLSRQHYDDEPEPVNAMRASGNLEGSKGDLSPARSGMRINLRCLSCYPACCLILCVSLLAFKFVLSAIFSPLDVPSWPPSSTVSFASNVVIM